MSNFFDDLGKAVTRAANSVGTEISVAAQEQRLREAYQALGRSCYEAARSGKAVQGEAFDAQLKKIDTLIESIHETRRRQNVADL